VAGAEVTVSRARPWRRQPNAGRSFASRHLCLKSAAVSV